MRTYPIAFEFDARNLAQNSVPRQYFRNTPGVIILKAPD